jgi:hypothetical protein
MTKEKKFLLGFKILSVLIAFALWVGTSGYKHTTIISKAFTIPVYFENISDDIVLIRDYLYEVNVQLSGPQRILKNLKREDVEVSINLKNKEIGKHSIPLEGYIKVPEEVTVEDTQPRSIEFRIEKKISKVLAIKPTVVGDPRDGYEVMRIMTMPSVTTVEGPESELKGVYNIHTDPIDITGKTSTVKANVTLIPASGYVKVKRNQNIEVTVVIEEENKTFLFKKLSIKKVNAKDKTVWINPKVVNVIATGQISYLEKINKKDIDVYIDCKDLKPKKEDYILIPTVDYKGDNREEILKHVKFKTLPGNINVRIY